MARLPGIASPITEDQFTTRAFERPSTFRESFGASAADAALQTPGLGTVIREGQAPPLAKAMDLTRSGLSSGRGGVAWRYETPQEVADKGDTLYENDNDFKKSPSYRPEVKFEKGMTESRAKALADMNDLSKVRQYYASKRPVAAFLGGVAGSALDPVNYIPIAGEVAQAAAVARVGRVAGRVLTTSADAALNSALFQTALSDTKAKYGDDVSWAAIAMNAAFAAMGGAVIGGVVGGLAKFRGWDMPDLEVRNENVPPVRDATQPQGEPVRPVSEPKQEEGRTGAEPAQTRETIPPEVGAAPRAPSHEAILARLETAANRKKSAEVMNDALVGLVHDTEVKLGQGSQDVIAEMKAKVDASAPRPINLDTIYRSAPARQSELEGTARTIAAEEGIEFRSTGIKKRATAEAKIGRKGYTSESQITDIVRGGFAVKTPTQVSSIIAKLGKSFDILDEGWTTTIAGYTDRKILVRFKDGTIGEIQIWPKNMIDAKDKGGHALYKIWRDLPDGTPEKQAAGEKMLAVYRDALSPAFKAVVASEGNAGRSGNISWKLASDRTTAPESATSATGAGSQLRPGDLINQAFDSPETNAGLRSQLTNDNVIEAPNDNIGAQTTLGKAMDYSPAKPDPVPRELPAASARVDAGVKSPDSAKAEIDRMVALAKEEGFDPEANTHDLELDIDALRAQDLLTAEDEAALKAIDESFGVAKAWDEVMQIAKGCQVKP